MKGHIGRRSFVGMALAGAAGLAAAMPSERPKTARARTPEPDAPGLRIRTAVKIGMIGVGETLAEKFAAAADAGFDGVELDSPGPHRHDEILEAKERTGIETHGVVLSTHWSRPFNHPDGGVRAEARAALETALRDAAAIDATTVLVVPAVVNRSMTYAEAYTLAQEAMRDAAPLADELRVSIAFENVWNNFLLSPLEAARFVDELNEGRRRRTFGWYFDIGNIVNYGWPEHWIDTLGERILKLDVKDFSRARRDEEGLWKGFGVGIGDGDAGWDRVRAALGRVGYAGWATAEVGGGDADRLADIHRRMHAVFGLDTPDSTTTRHDTEGSRP